MAATKAEAKSWPTPPIDPVKSTVVISFHVIAAVSAVMWYQGEMNVSLITIIFAFIWLKVTSLGVTAGYHRLFSHPTYKATWFLRLVLLLLAAAAFQGDVLSWSALHRMHHKYEDTEKDPYCILRGFWWAHILWVFCKTYPDLKLVRELQRDPLIRLQKKVDIPLEVFMCFVVPTLIGWIWGQPWETLFVVGFIRLVVQWHMTFAVNSVAHCWGEREWSSEITARTTNWIVGILTGGEGRSHNRHHRYPWDFRVSDSPAPDIPALFIWCCSKIGLASDLRRANAKLAA